MEPSAQSIEKSGSTETASDGIRSAATVVAEVVESFGGAEGTGPDALLDYYRALARLTKRPIFVQTSGGARSINPKVDALVELAREFPNCAYVKEEYAPILERIKSSPERDGIRALYITPLRALSRDLKERFDWWCERLDISHDIRTGDTSMAVRAKHRAKPPKILLTTVESLQALMLGRIMRRHLLDVEFVIVDEIHDIIDNKRGAQLSLGLERNDVKVVEARSGGKTFYRVRIGAFTDRQAAYTAARQLAAEGYPTWVVRE